MPTTYSIALKLSLDGVNQLKNSFSIATQEIKKASTDITGIVSKSTKQMKELASSSIVQAVGVGAVVASMTKASSPEEDIIIATIAPNEMIPCVYNDTVANPPMHPGTRPSKEATMTCIAGFPFSLENHAPFE